MCGRDLNLHPRHRLPHQGDEDGKTHSLAESPAAPKALACRSRDSRAMLL